MGERRKEAPHRPRSHRQTNVDTCEPLPGNGGTGRGRQFCSIQDIFAEPRAVMLNWRWSNTPFWSDFLVETPCGADPHCGFSCGLRVGRGQTHKRPPTTRQRGISPAGCSADSTQTANGHMQSAQKISNESHVVACVDMNLSCSPLCAPDSDSS